MIKNFFIVVIFTLLVSPKANRNRYVLEEVVATSLTGSTKFRKKEALRWHDIHSKVGLSVGDFIYLANDSSVSVKMPYQTADNKEQDVQMVFKGPRLIRVSSKMLREFKINVKKGGPGSTIAINNNKQNSEDEQMLAFEAADQMLAGEGSPSNEFIFSDNIDMQLGEDMKTSTEELSNSFLKTDLQILSPNFGTVIEEDSLPFEVKLVWELPKQEENKMHQVLIKEEGEDEYYQVAETENDFYTFQVPKPGTYDIVLRSQDGSYRSESTKVFLEYSDDAEIYKAKEPVKNVEPTPNMTYYSNLDPMSIFFVFKNPERGTVNADLYIKKTHPEQRPPSKQVLQIVGHTFVENKLSKGKYRWSIVPIGKKPPKDLNRWFKFEIKPGEFPLGLALKDLVEREGGIFKEETTLSFEEY